MLMEEGDIVQAVKFFLLDLAPFQWMQRLLEQLIS